MFAIEISGAPKRVVIGKFEAARIGERLVFARQCLVELAQRREVADVDVGLPDIAGEIVEPIS